MKVVSIKTISALAITFSTAASYAANTNPPPPPVPPVPVGLSIDGGILIATLLVVLLVFFKFKAVKKAV